MSSPPFLTAHAWAAHQSANAGFLSRPVAYAYEYHRWHNSGRVETWYTQRPDGSFTTSKGLIREDGLIFQVSERAVEPDLVWTPHRAQVVTTEDGSQQLSGTTAWNHRYN